MNFNCYVIFCSMIITIYPSPPVEKLAHFKFFLLFKRMDMMLDTLYLLTGVSYL